MSANIPGIGIEKAGIVIDGDIKVIGAHCLLVKDVFFDICVEVVLRSPDIELNDTRCVRAMMKYACDS